MVFMEDIAGGIWVRLDNWPPSVSMKPKISRVEKAAPY
jgi:hypothetical protein